MNGWIDRFLWMVSGWMNMADGFMDERMDK